MSSSGISSDPRSYPPDHASAFTTFKVRSLRPHVAMEVSDPEYSQGITTAKAFRLCPTALGPTSSFRWASLSNSIRWLGPPNAMNGPHHMNVLPSWTRNRRNCLLDCTEPFSSTLGPTLPFSSSKSFPERRFRNTLSKRPHYQSALSNLNGRARVE